MLRRSVLLASVLRPLGARSAATSVALEDDGIFFAKLLTGREIANPATAASMGQRQLFTMAQNMMNQQYIVGDRATKEAIVVDGNYDPEGVDRIAAEAGYDIVEYVATHFHYDHIGSVDRGIPGMKHWVDRGLPARIHALELDAAATQVGVPAASLSPYGDGETLAVGRVTLDVIHTPGHSPGSAVLVVRGASGEARLAITGDTVFAGSCGRLDLEGSSIDAMYESLNLLRTRFTDETMPLYPGHAYGAEATTVAEERRSGLLRDGISRGRWRAMMGA